MKLRTNIFILAAVFAFAFISVGRIVVAQEEQPEEIEIVQTRNDNAVERLDDNSNPSERALERRARVEAFIDDNRVERLRGNCVAAQARLEAAVQRAVGLETSRGEVFANISNRVNRLSTRLQATGVDTTVLDSQVAEFENLVVDFEQQIDQYRLALQDAQTLDCEEDPESFAYALEDARETLPELRQLSQQMRTQVREAIVSTLQDIRDTLGSSTESTESDTVEEDEIEPGAEEEA